MEDSSFRLRQEYVHLPHLLPLQQQQLQYVVEIIHNIVYWRFRAFRWMTGSCDGTSVGTGNNLVVSPSNTTTYYGRWENSCGNSTCQTVTVNVSSLTTSVIIEASTPLWYAAHLLLIKHTNKWRFFSYLSMESKRY
jgi:hypothetical protein